MTWSYSIIFVFCCDYGVVIVFVLLLSDGSFGGGLRFKSGVDGIEGGDRIEDKTGTGNANIHRFGAGWGEMGYVIKI